MMTATVPKLVLPAGRPLTIQRVLAAGDCGAARTAVGQRPAMPATFRHWLPAAARYAAGKYGRNLLPTLAYHTHRSDLPPAWRPFVADLRRDGIAMTSLEALGCTNRTFRTLHTLQSLAAAVEFGQQDAIASARQSPVRARTLKDFIWKGLGDRPTYDLGSVWAALAHVFAPIATAYLGMHARLRYYNLWRAFVTAGWGTASQCWHRDPEDCSLVKVFVYLTDVTPEAGPFWYVAGSHPQGRWAGEPAAYQEPTGIHRTSNPQMRAWADESRWRCGTGPAGTVIIADTRGFHKGGLCRTTERLLYTCTFTSLASTTREMFAEPTRIVCRA